MGLGPRKKWSQNFLINRQARERLVDSLDFSEGDRIWEIGPGLGAITSHLAEKKADITVFEIDPGYIEYLSMVYQSNEAFRIVKGDVVKTWKEEFERSGRPDGVIGNFPYNAASAIIASFIESGRFPSQMAAIVQSEMADRITAKRGSKNYSSFSIICQYSCDVKDVGAIGSGSFYPRPNVSSRIIKMTPRVHPEELIDPELFFILVRDCFSSRRKTLQNNLKNAAARRLQKYGKECLLEAFESTGIALSARAETLTVDQYVSVANSIVRLHGES
jgi:16S rRNA (adenine1518-N6/adenine1519-N6)-dimethyltransferase